jgi:hypothetical protein
MIAHKLVAQMLKYKSLILFRFLTEKCRTIVRRQVVFDKFRKIDLNGVRDGELSRGTS